MKMLLWLGKLMSALDRKQALLLFIKIVY